MQPSVALRRPSFSLSTVIALVALLLAFAVGAASGYAVKAVSTPRAAAAVTSAICPAGTHVAVWYSAKSWSCLSNP